MENCLVTKLKGSVNNTNLEKLGVLKLKLAHQTGTRRIDTFVSGGYEMTVYGTAVFTDSTGSTDRGQHITYNASYLKQEYLKNVSDGDILEVKSKYNIVQWGANTSTELKTGVFESLEWLTGLQTLNLGNNHSGVSVDLNTLTRYSSNVKSIIIINDTECTGTIETMVENLFPKRTVSDNLVMTIYKAVIKLNNATVNIPNSSTNITIAFTSTGATVTLGSAQIAEYDKDNGWTYSS